MPDPGNPRTDLSSVTYNEDGSTTYVERYTTYPASKGEKITTGLVCTLGVALAFAPLAWEVFIEKREARRLKREAEKAKSHLDPKN